MKALQSFMGHANVLITVDRYGHLMRALRPRRRACSTLTSAQRERAEEATRGAGAVLATGP